MNANIAYVIGTGFTPQALVRKRVKVTEDGKEVVKTIELESWNEFTEELSLNGAKIATYLEVRCRPLGLLRIVNYFYES